MNAHDFDFECQQLELKRQLLNKLIHFAQDVSRQTQGLEDLLLLTRPSQEYPERVKKSVSRLADKIKNLDDDQLRLQANKQEQAIQQRLKAIIGFVEQTHLHHQGPDFSFPDNITEQLDQFKKLNQTAVALRALMQERSIILPPLKSGIPQDWLAEQVAELKETNRDLRKRIKKQIHEMISDSHRLLALEELPDTLRQALQDTEDAMRENLQHLQAGGSIHSFPHNFESLELTALPPATESSQSSLSPETEPQEAIPLPDVEESPGKRNGFFKRVSIWLSSPWETRWKDIH